MATKIKDFFDLAIKYNASDLFLISGSQPALKVNGDVGVVKNFQQLETKDVESFLAEIMKNEEKSFFEENSDIDFAYDYEDKVRLRINAFVTRKGVGVTFRLIPEEIKTLEDLSLPEQLKKVAAMKSGLVLTTGSVGSGKTTTLASVLDLINKTRRAHIVTIEDPIEYIHENKSSIVTQREVGVHTRSFASGLRGALREAADVIMVGELRDNETMDLAINAAETGVLVLATLHTRGAANVADRIIGSFPADKQSQIRTQVSQSLKAVIWQMLIKTADKKSRVPATELLFNNYGIANMIRKGQTHQIYSSIETGGMEGMYTMEQSLKLLAAGGQINPDDMKYHMQGIENL